MLSSDQPTHCCVDAQADVDEREVRLMCRLRRQRPCGSGLAVAGCRSVMPMVLRAVSLCPCCLLAVSRLLRVAAADKGR
jgi:hypothetical protein